MIVIGIDTFIFISAWKQVMYDSNSGIGIDSGMIPLLPGIRMGIGIRLSQRCMILIINPFWVDGSLRTLPFGMRQYARPFPYFNRE